MARYLGCGICMKVCPIQKYGLKNVMEHYAETGQVLGKGTHDLEGYTLEGKGYFGPGEMPVFDAAFFAMPHGGTDEYAFETFKERARETGGEVSDEMLQELKGRDHQVHVPGQRQRRHDGRGRRLHLTPRHPPRLRPNGTRPQRASAERRWALRFVLPTATSTSAIHLTREPAPV